jgi:putative intracellular protease/amidase
MSKKQKQVLVLWGDKFEEATAALFVSELRKVGLRVKVVGLTPPKIRGAYGLALEPDLTLDQALPLATKTTCLVIPHSLPGLKRLKNDPRLEQFFDQALQKRAKIIIGSLNGSEITELDLWPAEAVELVSVYPEDEAVVAFARDLANSLRNGN